MSQFGSWLGILELEKVISCVITELEFLGSKGNPDCKPTISLPNCSDLSPISTTESSSTSAMTSNAPNSIHSLARSLAYYSQCDLFQVVRSARVSAKHLYPVDSKLFNSYSHYWVCRWMNRFNFDLTFRNCRAIRKYWIDFAIINSSLLNPFLALKRAYRKWIFVFVAKLELVWICFQLVVFVDC